ncbi:hypothetical protein AAVH_21349 [Aphelenchoides avenae]|nr:hypothetical protein AAVH_21349 [Aphelenchus avenae]
MELVEPEESDEDEPDEASDDSDDERARKAGGFTWTGGNRHGISYSSDEESDDSEIDAELDEDLSVLERESKEEVHVLVEPIYDASLSQPTFDEVCTLASMRCEAMSEYCRSAHRPLADAHATRILVGDATQRFQQEVSPLSVTTVDLLDLPFPMPFEQAQRDLERIKDRMDDRAFDTARVDRRNHEKLKADIAAQITALDSSGKWSTLATLTDKDPVMGGAPW